MAITANDPFVDCDVAKVCILTFCVCDAVRKVREGFLPIVQCFFGYTSTGSSSLKRQTSSYESQQRLDCCWSIIARSTHLHLPSGYVSAEC